MVKTYPSIELIHILYKYLTIVDGLLSLITKIKVKLRTIFSNIQKSNILIKL